MKILSKSCGLSQWLWLSATLSQAKGLAWPSPKELSLAQLPALAGPGTTLRDSNKIDRFVRSFWHIDLPKHLWVLHQHQAISVTSDELFDQLQNS